MIIQKKVAIMKIKLFDLGIILVLATWIAGYTYIVKKEVDFCEGIKETFCDNHNKPPKRNPYWK